MNNFQLVKSKIRLFLPCLLLTTAGCVSKINAGGYVSEVNVRNEIIIGETTQEQVIDRLGSPSARSSFGEETWYYISERIETVAFLKPEVTDQEVTRIAFDDTGHVKSIDQLSRKDALEFSSVKRETPTEGHSMGVMEQLIGNIGRFNNTQQRRPGSVPGSPGGI